MMIIDFESPFTKIEEQTKLDNFKICEHITMNASETDIISEYESVLRIFCKQCNQEYSFRVSEG